MNSIPVGAIVPTRAVHARGVVQRLLVFVPARRSWPGGARGGIGPTTPMPYVALQGDGALEEGTAPLAQMPRARAIELVFDSLDVYSATIEAPRLGEVRLRQALPNLLEERMLGDLADHHFASMPSREAPAPGTPEGAGASLRLSVAAIDRSTLARALEACQQAQLQPRAAYSDIYTLPRPVDGVFGARLGAGGGLLRTGQDEGCHFDAAEGAAGALALARRQYGIRALRMFGQPPEQAAAQLAAAGVAHESAGRALDASALDDAVNLLQGPYAAVGGYGMAGRLVARLARGGAWKAPAAWIGVCAAIAVGGLNAYWLKLDAENRGVRASMQRAFRDAFPNEPPVDELAQARRDVAALRARAGRPSSDDFSTLNAQAAQLMASAPVGVVAGVDYGNGTYTLHFFPGSMDNPGQRNALQARAIAQGLALRFGGDGSALLTPIAAAGP